MHIEIIFPVLNEENRLKKGIETTLDYLSHNKIDNVSIIIADNGSTDSTEKIAKELVENNVNIRYIKLPEKGVGLALREGIKISNADVIGYMDVDLSTDINHFKEVVEIFKDQQMVDMVIGSRNSTTSKVKDRTVVRNITSNGLSFTINMILGTTKSDYMCGFKFFRRKKIENIINVASDYKGWFYCAEIIIIAEWLKYNIVELPVLWIDDKENSKVNGKMFKIIKEYLSQIYLLRKNKKSYFSG